MERHVPRGQSRDAYNQLCVRLAARWLAKVALPKRQGPVNCEGKLALASWRQAVRSKSGCCVQLWHVHPVYEQCRDTV